MDNPLAVTAITAALIVLSAFFVVIEFALLGARKHRLEKDAETSASARAALRGIHELTMMLAGAQLGITACTFALGAVTKPAVDSWLGPTFASWGAPDQLAGGVAFGLSLLFVTFLHLVVGEMAPKSWAIAHPEFAAKLIGIPARGFIWVFRPLLSWVNAVANRLVSASGVTPVERAAVGGQDADTIRQLVEHSAEAGALDQSFSSPLAGALGLEDLDVGALVDTSRKPTAVPADATVAQVHEAAARTGHMRILVLDSEAPVPSVVHVRDTLMEPDHSPVLPLTRPVMVLDIRTPVYEALGAAREQSEQLAAVMDQGRFVGVITIADILKHLLPEDAEPTR
ncbi:hemolysin family protein [Rhodococcus sp. IEGM 1408]|uniref:hemolysin family protein n=1 Tax=Rhodococcus sp. IEGM 1408 TaxID=3082220 RepID=UPI002952B793|nr:hemolysin family protein [Rhodococcus sp. IEGM 1408]MDV8001062.1 hemolysin family protein [Rhodococcus sp. IEGM 1408]